MRQGVSSEHVIQIIIDHFSHHISVFFLFFWCAIHADTDGHFEENQAVFVSKGGVSILGQQLSPRFPPFSTEVLVALSDLLRCLTLYHGVYACLLA